MDTPDNPLVITGDCLARITDKKLEQGEFEFKVFDKIGEEYELNPNKRLSLTTEYDFDEDLTIVTSVSYSVSLPPAEFEQIKNAREKEKTFKNRKSGRPKETGK